MSLLSQITSGRECKPPRCTIHGGEGDGKSTFGSQAPRPIFIQTEDGLSEIDCAKFPLARAIQEVEAALDALIREEHPYLTVVIDSLDWAERLIFDAVCRDFGVQSIEKADGGYGKGYIHALPYWRRIIEKLDTLRDRKGMAVILIAHSKIERFEDPDSAAYDRYCPRLNKHAAALICEWSDAVLFAHKKFRTEKQTLGFGRERAIAVGIGADGGERVLRTVGGPSCVAKNRYSLPAEIPLSWPALASGIAGKLSN